MDIIFEIEKKYLENQNECHIILELPKAFGSIEIYKLRRTLYEYGHPGNLIRAIFISPNTTHMSAKHINNRGPPNSQ